jgi:hypothetical protein
MIHFVCSLHGTDGPPGLVRFNQMTVAENGRMAPVKTVARRSMRWRSEWRKPPADPASLGDEIRPSRRTRSGSAANKQRVIPGDGE